MMETYFRELMTVPCSVLRNSPIEQDDGVIGESLSYIENTVCHYHSININLMEMADKDTEKGAFIFCLPKNANVKTGDIIMIEETQYRVVGVRKANMRFETICECVLYE